MERINDLLILIEKNLLLELKDEHTDNMYNDYNVIFDYLFDYREANKLPLVNKEEILIEIVKKMKLSMQTPIKTEGYRDNIAKLLLIYGNINKFILHNQEKSGVLFGK